MTTIPVRFPVLQKDVLSKGTRKTVETWLRSQPRNAEGHAFCAIQQRFHCEVQSHQDIPLLDIYKYERMKITPRFISPIIPHPSRVGHCPAWAMEMTDECLRPFRDAFYEISFDETPTRLFSSEAEILCARGGSTVDLFHLPGATLALSQAYSSHAPDDDSCRARYAAASGHLFLLPARTQHERLRQNADLARVNMLLPCLAEALTASATYLNLMPIEAPLRAAA